MSMELRIIHFYPDLMSLYGSYANVSVLKRALERMGNTVRVERVDPEGAAELSGADFIFMGAGTERKQKFALTDFARFGADITAAAESGTAMLFAGTAMELLGKEIVDAESVSYPGIGLGNFTAKQQVRRIVGDVYGHTDLYQDAVVGFMNKSSLLSGIETPLLTGLDLGFGNEAERGAEGFRYQNVLGSCLTGPILAKNPRLLDFVITAIYAKRGEPLPALPRDEYAENGYAITAQALKERCGN